MKFILALISLFLIPGATIACWNGIGLICDVQSLWLPLLLGIAIGLLLYYLIIRKIHVLQNFEHELAHALMALLFLRKVSSFKFSGKRGGMVKHSDGFGGEFGNLMILISPYFLPTYTIIALLFRPLVTSNWLFYYTIFIGFTIIYHVLSSIDEIKRNWSSGSFTSIDGEPSKTDIKRTGYITAFFAITAFTLISFGLVFQVIPLGYPGVWRCIKMVGVGSWKIYAPLVIKGFHFLQQQLG